MPWPDHGPDPEREQRRDNPTTATEISLASDGTGSFFSDVA